MKMLSMLPKKSLSILTTLTYLSFVAAPASAANFDKSLEDDLIKICEAVKSDSKLKLNRSLKNTHLDYRTVAKGLVCNGMPVYDFAQKHQAKSTADLLAMRAQTANSLLTMNKSY